MNARGLLSALLVALDEDEQARSRRSQRDWIVDGILFLLAAVFGALAVADAVGRGLESYDRLAVNKIVQSMGKENDRFSALLLAIVKSDPFQKRTTPGGSR